MNCPACNYLMDVFDSECPRCHGKGLSESAPETAADAATAAAPTQAATATNTTVAPPANNAKAALTLEAQAHQERLIAEALMQAKEMSAPTRDDRLHTPITPRAQDSEKGARQEKLITNLLAKAGAVAAGATGAASTATTPTAVAPTETTAPVAPPASAEGATILEDTIEDGPLHKLPPLPDGSSFAALVIIGVIMLALGLGAVGYYAVIFKATVALESGKKVLNVGLQAQRHAGVLKGMLLALVGVAFLAAGITKPKWLG